ncbi:MAG: hypothetical protein R3F19_29305 [Verrucomicrobiales bacterium]
MLKQSTLPPFHSPKSATWTILSGVWSVRRRRLPLLDHQHPVERGTKSSSVDSSNVPWCNARSGTYGNAGSGDRMCDVVSGERSPRRQKLQDHSQGDSCGSYSCGWEAIMRSDGQGSSADIGHPQRHSQALLRSGLSSIQCGKKLDDPPLVHGQRIDGDPHGLLRSLARIPGFTGC